MDPTQSGDLQQATAAHETTTEAANGVKKRWRRNRIACDSCHSRRVRCDRAFPCSRCLRNEIHCEFTRERRKRGRISRKRLLENSGNNNNSNDNVNNGQNGSVAAPSATAPTSVSPSLQKGSPSTSSQNQSPNTLNDATAVSAPSVEDQHFQADRPPGPTRSGIGGNVTEEWLTTAHLSPDSYAGWGDGPLPRPLEGWTGVDHAPPSIDSRTGMGQTPKAITSTSLKYPVLQPLMPFLEGYLPRRLAFDLLELYFTSAFSTHIHPVCHHIHCYILRKASFLTRDTPRRCSPALLASILWVAALDDRAFALSISPHQRKKICQFLCALTVRLLRPLIHVSFKGQDPSMGENGSTGASHERSPRAMHPFAGDDRGLVGPAGSLDDVITYIHVASIISASEQKAASMRW